MTNQLLDVSGITKSFEHHPVLQGINLQLAEGEVLALVGENGVGKTTLMQILAGEQQADGGQMLLEGKPYAPTSTDEAQQMGVGIIRQRFRLDPGLTVAKAVHRTGFQKDRPHEELRRQTAMLLREIGSDISPDATIGELMPSEHAIVEAVRILAEDAQVVIMDEVGTTFNLREISDLHFITSRLSSQGRGIIYISHRLQEVKAISDRIAVLNDGQISQELDPREVSTADIAQAMLKNEVDLSRPDNSTDEVVLEVSGLTTEDGRAHDVGFVLHRGEVLGLSGDKQAGMYAIANALVGRAPYEGTIHIHGQVHDTSNDAEQLRIGYFSEDDELGEGTGETIASSLMTTSTEGIDFKTEIQARREVAEQIKKLSVKSTGLQASVDTLSGGDRQKVALTRWMAQDRDILILNEPTRGLDVGARAQIRSILADHTAAGRSAIVISSDPEDLTGWCNRILLMEQGTIVEEMTPEYDFGRLAEALGGDSFQEPRRAV